MKESQIESLCWSWEAEEWGEIPPRKKGRVFNIVSVHNKKLECRSLITDVRKFKSLNA